MKVLLLTLGLFLVATHGAPFGGDPEFAMVPHADGWKLVNLNAEPELENFYNPEADMWFRLFTNDDREGQLIRWNDPSSIAGSRFNPANPTRLTIHGWGGSGNDGVNTNIRNALFQVGQFNVIAVDWSAGASTNNYLTARNRVGPTGTVVGRLLELLSAHGANFQDMTVIGFSLGAHVAGFSGKANPNRLGAVVALDAAGPLFNINNPEGRVDANDAIYVESIHTNAGLLGFDQPIGDSNFYPNWGRSQPGCGLDVTGNCAHSRAVHFMAESITSQVGFWARRCRTYQDIVDQNCVSNGPNVRMGGEPLNTNSYGVFWLETNAAAPFARGQM